MRLTLTTALLLLAACGSSSSSSDTEGRLDPLDNTGLTQIDMNGTWEVTKVEIVDESGNVREPATEPLGFMPPTVGAKLVIAEGELIRGDERELARDTCGFREIRSWLNRADGQYALYDRFCFSPSNPNMLDGGGAQRLQLALGAIDDDRMIGLTEHLFSVAFPPQDRPVAGRYRVELERVRTDE